MGVAVDNCPATFATAMLKFLEALARRGWREIDMWEHAKGDWRVFIDTGSWLLVGTSGNPRAPNVEVTPDADTDDAAANWIVDLIEHLCGLEDERQRLRRALEQARDAADGTAARLIAVRALSTVHFATFATGRRTPPPRIVDHFATMAVEQRRLARALGEIRDRNEPGAPRLIAERALADCYHTWLVDERIGTGRMGSLYCPICGQHEVSRH
jgi:hypothetical protein